MNKSTFHVCFQSITVAVIATQHFHIYVNKQQQMETECKFARCFKMDTVSMLLTNIARR